MRQFVLAVAVLTLAVTASGCGVGIIYTHTYQPLTLDMHRTPLVPTSGEGDVKYLVLYYDALSAAWDDASIGDIARKNGLQELYCADLETLSILHIWNQYTVHLYGK